jgi:HK97 family phage prohead protease
MTKTIDEHDEDITIETKHLEATIEKKDDGSFIAIASSNAVDRHGEVVDNNGWDLKAFKKNPVILWGHDHNEPAIGVSKKTWVEGTGKKAKLMIQPVLHDVTEKARAVKALVDLGVIRTLSVGFKPLESPDGITFTKNELLEVSMVNVPANPEAMALAYKGLKKEGINDEVMREFGLDPIVLDKLMLMEEAIEELQAMVKAQPPVNPSQQTKIVRERLSFHKVIARAADKILEADKKGVPVNQKELVKTIKRANELLTVAEKDKL